MNILPCPLCNSTNLADSTWYLEDGEVDAVECNDCYAGAPVTAWNRDRWNYGEPPMDTWVLLTYRHHKGHECGPIISIHTEGFNFRPTIRWMPLPPIPCDYATVDKTQNPGQDKRIA